MRWPTTIAQGQRDAGAGDGTVIGNVAAGAVSATSTEAVNGSQLYGALDSTATALGGGAG